MTAIAPRTISLVLGSGGARGMAHVGVIRWLEENGYRIESISGCSIGALIGGIYAAGKLDEFVDWICAIDRLDILRLLDFTWGVNGLVRGDRMIGALVELVGDQQIEDLPVRYTAVATNLRMEKEIWLNSGRLFNAIRASISLPLFFTPFRYRDMDLIDGGVLNPVPIAPTFDDGTDLTIAVNLEGPPNQAIKPQPPGRDDRRRASAVRDTVQHFLTRLGLDEGDTDEDTLNAREIIHQTFDAMQGTIARHQLATYPPDRVVTIPRNVCSLLEFDRAGEMIELGYRRAAQCLHEPTAADIGGFPGSQ
jgi:NTE family protein